MIASGEKGACSAKIFDVDPFRDRKNVNLQPVQGGERVMNGNDSDETPILVDSRRSDRRPVALLKRANVTVETVRAQGTVGAV